MTFAEFFHMGGYGLYIWGSYALGALVFAALFFSVKQQHEGLLKQLAREMMRKQAQARHQQKVESNSDDNN